MPLQYENLTAAQFKLLPPRNTVFFFPVGPLEDHGPHLSLGLDIQIAEGICRTLAERLEKELPGWVGVMMPRCPLGIQSNTKKFAITVRPHVLRDWLVDACRSLIGSGFFHFVCFTGHAGPKQLTAIEEAGKIIRRQALWRPSQWKWGIRSSPRPSLVSASSALATWKNTLQSPLWPDPEEHGGKEDTSLALKFSQLKLTQPELSHSELSHSELSHSELSHSELSHSGLSRSELSHSELSGPEILPQGLPALSLDPSFWTRSYNRLRKKVEGYWGDPAEASAEYGEERIQETVDILFPKLRAVWEGANPESLFRSWYSIIPPNKSFFISYVIALAFFMIFLTWALLTIRALELGTR